MKHIFTLCLLFISCVVSSRLFSQSFTKEYRLGTSTIWQVIKPTSDGNLIAVGDYTTSETSPNIIMITKLQPDGSVLWSKTYGGDIQQNGLHITETADSSLVIAGVEFVYDFISNEFSAIGCLIKLSKDGDLRWSHYLQAGNHNYFLLTHVAPTADGGVIAGGNFEQFGGGTVGSFAYLAKIDTAGNIVWQKQFDTKSYRRWIAGIFCSGQKVMVVSESSIGSGNNAKDAAAITWLTEADGTVVKSKQFRLPGAGIHFIQAADATPDGGIVVSGAAGKGIGDFDIWIFKTDDKLNLQWSTLVANGADDRPNKVYAAADGSILIGAASSGSDQFFHPYLLWLNANGHVAKNQQLTDLSRGIFGITAIGNTTYALAIQQFGTGSNPYASLSAWNGREGVCTQNDSSGTWATAPGVITANRKIPATDVTAMVSDMNYTVADVFVSSVPLCSVLPVQLLFFSGVYQSNQVVLTWQTANEVNTSFFTVEKSVDGGVHYTGAGTIAAKGVGNNNYSYTDATPVNGRVFYRLQIRNRNGSAEYSDVVEVKATLKAAVIYPNPVKDELTLLLTLPQPASLQVSINNTMGQNIIRQSLSAGAGVVSKTIDVSKLAAGVYFINIQSAGINESLRFEKQ